MGLILSLCFIILRDSRDFATYMHNLWINMRYSNYGCPCTRFALEFPVKGPYACKKIKLFLKNGKWRIYPISTLFLSIMLLKFPLFGVNVGQSWVICVKLNGRTRYLQLVLCSRKNFKKTIQCQQRFPSSIDSCSQYPFLTHILFTVPFPSY